MKQRWPRSRSAIESLDRQDMQGLLARGFGNLPFAEFILLRVLDREAAASVFSRWAASVTTAAESRPPAAVNIALTAPGIPAITGSPPPDGFSEQFLAGMATKYRSRLLGDLGDEAPEGWAWGGPGTEPVHVAVLLYAGSPEELATRAAALTDEAANGGWHVVARLETSKLGLTEPFGFHDGISQPRIAGMGGREDRAGAEEVKAGEFILGYPNEYGQLTPRPLLSPDADPDRILPRDPGAGGAADLGRNGSYLVVRQIAQDVRGFWDFVERAARDDSGGLNPGAKDLLAAKMVGRWPGGAPLVLSPDHDDPSLADANDFGYHAADPLGRACPLGSHVRRVNPRDSLEPRPGTESSLAINRRHRLLRRGRAYGEGGDPAAEQGIYFICLNANLARQYEFIQHSWVNNPAFNGLYDDADPLIGPRHTGGATFTEPANPVRRRYNGLPQFVRVRGGGYFFLPGISALRYLSTRRA